MRRFTRDSSAFGIAILGVLLSAWLVLLGSLIVTRGEPEAFLVTTFGRFSRDDAFEHLNAVSKFFFGAHTCLVLIATEATLCRRSDVLAVLMVGPIIALAIALFGQRWTDPNWFEVVGVCTICWFVGAVVGITYWVLKRKSPVSGVVRASH